MKLPGWAALLFTMLAGAPAVAAPPQLLDKTVTVSFTATGMAKSPDGVQKSFSTQVTRVIYVSSAGRPFLRHRISNRNHSRGGDYGPGEIAGSVDFQGDRMVIVQPFHTGARQITVTFDSTYSSCSIAVIEGHSSGVIRRTGPSGLMHEVTGSKAISPSCSIRKGNAFAGD